MDLFPLAIVLSMCIIITTTIDLVFLPFGEVKSSITVAIEIIVIVQIVLLSDHPVEYPAPLLPQPRRPQELA